MLLSIVEDDGLVLNIVLTCMVSFTAAKKKCGDKTFNNKNRMCCHGAIVKRPAGSCDPANHKCCDKKSFDNSIQQCCYGVINDRPDCDREHHKCCGNVAFCNDKYNAGWKFEARQLLGDPNLHR